MLADLTRMNKMFIHNLSYFLKKLADTPEGDGSMLDNTIVFNHFRRNACGIHLWVDADEAIRKLASRRFRIAPGHEFAPKIPARLMDVASIEAGAKR